MYEKKHVPPISRQSFVLRLSLHAAIATAILAVSLMIGIGGYAYFERLSAIDAFLNASMLLGGMGPVNPPLTAGGKLFAGLYALYSGLVFLIAFGVMLTPVLHRVLHTFHWSQDQ